jgi:PPOX class probable F420-dependent enzyme
LVYSQPNRQKPRNISRNPRVALNLNSNIHRGDIVRVEGMAEIVKDAPRADVVPEYVEKYRDYIARIGFDSESFVQTYLVPLRVTPTRWQVWYRHVHFRKAEAMVAPGCASFAIAYA